MTPNHRKEIEERVDPAIPERIWLQVYGDELPPFDELTRDDVGMATWCQDRINESDIEYVRLDAAEARAKELQAENDILRGIASKVMPCHHCGVDSLGKCPMGFPGCALADDVMACDETHVEGLRARAKAAEEALKEIRIKRRKYPGGVRLSLDHCWEDDVPNLAKWLKAQGSGE